MGLPESSHSGSYKKKLEQKKRHWGLICTEKRLCEHSKKAAICKPRLEPTQKNNKTCQELTLDF